MDKKITNEELLTKFEAIVKELEQKCNANKDHNYLIYKFAVSDVRERLEQLKQGLY